MSDWISKGNEKSLKDLMGMFGKGKGGLRIPPLPRSVKLVLTLVLVLGFFCVITVSTMVDYVKPYEYGIKQVNVGVKRGVLEKV